MTNPARAWLNRSSLPNGKKLKPAWPSKTTVSIVVMVTNPKTVATITVPDSDSRAAGYISSGIKGSQGPKTKIVNSTHGVKRLLPFST